MFFTRHINTYICLATVGVMLLCKCLIYKKKFFRRWAGFGNWQTFGNSLYMVNAKRYFHNILLYIRRSLWKFRIFFPQIHFASEYSKGKRGLNTKLYLLKITNQRTDLLCDSHINFIFMQVFSYSCCCFFFKNFEVLFYGAAIVPFRVI